MSGLLALAGDAPHSWIMIDALRRAFGDFPVLLEEGEGPAFWRRRRKRLGLAATASMQAARLPARLSKRGAARRVAELVEANGLRTAPPDRGVECIPSVNSEAARQALMRHRPDAVFVVSTRMIGAKTREAAGGAPLVNYHSGIAPDYRGMHGGYFALASGRPDRYGTTFHRIDRGVDTGAVQRRVFVTPDPRDTFHTHTVALAAASRGAAAEVMGDALAGRSAPAALPDTDTAPGPSRQWYAPTLGGYLAAGLRRGVW